MADKHAVVRTDNMLGTDARFALVSVKYMGANGKTPTAIENGNVLKLNGLMAGEREIYVGGAVAANTPINEVVLIASPEVCYDERLRNLDDFINEEGKACRGYVFHSGQTFGVTKEALAGEAKPAVGDIVELAAGTQMKVVKKAAGATSGSTVIGEIIDIEIAGRYTYHVIKVK